jgi:hypothetical protein
MADAYINRVKDGVEWEVGILFKVEEYYYGRNNTDDPSYCAINEKVTVDGDVVDPEHGVVFKDGETLYLTDDERRDLEEDEFNRHVDEQRESYYEWLADDYY